MIVLLCRFKWVLHQLCFEEGFQKDATMYHVECTKLQKYSLEFFCDCFVTIPSYLVKDPGDEEYKKIYLQLDCFSSMS